MLHPDGGERAGIGHYTTHLVTALVKNYPRDEFVLLSDHRLTDNPHLSAMRQRKNVRIVFFPSSKYKKYLPFGYSHVVVARALTKERLDVFHAPATIIPLQYRGPAVITVHDLAIYDHPEWFPPGQKFSKGLLVPASLSRATRIIAVSAATKQMIVKKFGTAAQRIRVVHEGVAAPQRIAVAAAAGVFEKFQIGSRFFLFIGTIEPRKNLQMLTHAFNDVMEQNFPRFRDVQLIIAGAKGWRYESIFRVISHSPWSGSIRVIGYVTEEEKQVLLQRALAFVFPSLWEGFGLPIVEAMRAGAPVITSNISSLPEVGDSACLYISPHNKKALRNAMLLLLTKSAQRKQLSQRGRERARAFTWQRCAQQTHAVYDEVVKRK